MFFFVCLFLKGIPNKGELAVKTVRCSTADRGQNEPIQGSPAAMEVQQAHTCELRKATPGDWLRMNFILPPRKAGLNPPWRCGWSLAPGASPKAGLPAQIGNAEQGKEVLPERTASPPSRRWCAAQGGWHSAGEGRVPSATARGTGFHTHTHAAQLKSGNVVARHAPLPGRQGIHDSRDWMSEGEETATFRWGPKPTKTISKPRGMSSGLRKRKGSDLHNSESQALLHNDPSGRGWRSSSGNCLHKQGIRESSKQTCPAPDPILHKIALRKNNIQGTPVDRYRLLTLRFGPTGN